MTTYILAEAAAALMQPLIVALIDGVSMHVGTPSVMQELVILRNQKGNEIDHFRSKSEVLFFKKKIPCASIFTFSLTGLTVSLLGDALSKMEFMRLVDLICSYALKFVKLTRQL